jgi:hypothetical protein
LGCFSLPTCVGLRYGQKDIWLEAFLDGVGFDDFRLLAQARPNAHAVEIGICLDLALHVRSPSCPFDGFTSLTASPHHSYDVFWCRTFIPACHRLRLLRPRLRTRLTLGRLTLPRNPQAFGVHGSYTQYATHSGILTSRCSTSPHGLASPLENAPLPCSSPHYNVRRLNIHSFGKMLEPRYVVGATALDQ